MKILVYSLILLFTQFSQSTDYSDVAGEWRGIIAVSGQELGVNFTFSYTEGELDGMIDIPQQNAFNLPVEFTRAEGDSLTFQFETGTGPAIFRGVWNREEKEISGDFLQLNYEFSFSIGKRDSGNTETDGVGGLNLEIPTRAGKITGTLKSTEHPSPLVILLTGSGSQTRDAEVGGFKIFTELASQLHSSGFSTFRYDDRGTGGSEGVPDATLYDLKDDLVDVITHLRENHSDKFTNVVLLGHSQGGMVASLTARQLEIDGIIYAGVPFLSGDKVINQQILTISEAQGIDEAIVEQNLEFQNRIYNVVKTEGDWAEIEKDLSDRLEAQINALPEPQRNALGDMTSFIQSQINRQLAGAKTDWFKSFIEFEPSESIAQLEIPMLAVFGEKDSQVILGTNRGGAETLAEEHGLKLEIVTIPDANHLFQKANTGLPSEYGMLEREFAEGFVGAIVEWLNRLD